MPFSTRRKVGYFYDPDVGNFYYAQGHPMKPHRMRMTHNLLLAYGLFDKMDILTSPRASEREMTRFHSDEYINFLKVVTPDNMNEQYSNLSRFNILEDCPVFDGLWEYCQIAAGGSLAGAARLNSGESGTVINWAGGLHHAKRTEASGFCYINDCVLAILELLKVHARVLYVDIDIHHGDGVEEAFYTTDRVMTVSFHKFGDYFPGTGDVTDIGTGRGKNYSVNFPLKDGINDDSYREIFTPVMKRVMEWYQPGAVVMQCGADSLSGDRLGCFNLSLTGHSQCVDFFGEYDVPLLLLGGGGYTIRNVARCWAYETSRVLNADITDELPFNENYEFYGPEFRLHISTSNMEDHNTPAFLNKTKAKILEQLRGLPHAPSVPFADVPRTTPMGLHIRDEDSDNDDPDVRKKSNRAKHIVEYDGSDDDADDDQYLSSLRVARKKVRKSSFPRRSASRVQRTSTTLGPNATSNSPSNPFTASNAAELAPVVSMSAVNGSHMPESGFGSNHAGLLVQTRESATAATSDERLERQPGLFPLGSGALDTNVDSSTGGNRTGRNRYLDSNVDRKRARTDGGATQWDANTRPGGGPSNKESGDAREVGTVRDRLSPSRKKNNESPTPENMDISDEPKARHGAEVRTLSPVHSTSLRGASPSPEKVMMEDVTPANPPAKTSKDKEMNVVKEPPSVGSTEVLASVSKQSPSVSTHDTADKTEPVKSTERATGTDASSLAKSVHAADKSGDNARPQKENNGHPKLSDEEGALKPDAEVTASRPTSENIKVSSSSDIRQTGSETIRGPKDVVAGTKKDGQSTVVKAGSPSELDKPSFGSFVKDGDMSRPSHLEEKLSRGTKDNKNLPKSSHKIGPGAPKSPSKRPSPPRKVSPVSQLPTAKVSELSESAEKYGTDKSEKSSQDDKRIGAGDKLKVMGSGPAGSDDDPPRKAGGNLAPVKPAVTNSEHKPSSAKDAAANPEKEGLQSSPGVGSEGTSVTGMVSAPGKSAAPVDAANKSGSSGP